MNIFYKRGEPEIVDAFTHETLKLRLDPSWLGKRFGFESVFWSFHTDSSGLRWFDESGDLVTDSGQSLGLSELYQSAKMKLKLK